MERMDIGTAWSKSPGPNNAKQALLLAGKGFCMGVADIIPGVSGGTIAFITGIYEHLLAAIKSFGLNFFSCLARFDLAGALSQAHLRFLLPLLGGLVMAVLLMSRVMHHLLLHYPVYVWSLFFGLIVASIWVVGSSAGRFGVGEIFAFVLGTVGSWLLVGVVPVVTPEALWFVFLCGSLAVCAMILPGISGAYILVLLGKYEFITSTLKSPLADGNLLVILVFVAGCVVGVISFSRLLHYFLTRFHSLFICLLTGFMLGALHKVWPWKEVLASRMINGREVILSQANVLPDNYGAPFVLALGLMAIGFILVFVLERVSRNVSK